MDYVKYVDEVSKDKSQYTFPDILTGIKKLSDDYTVMHGLDVMLRGAIQEHPYDLPDIKLFGKTRPKFYCLMLTKNSPLTPIFMKAITRTTEQGVLDRMAVSWTGPPITYSGEVYTKLRNLPVVRLSFSLPMLLASSFSFSIASIQTSGEISSSPNCSIFSRLRVFADTLSSASLATVFPSTNI